MKNIPIIHIIGLPGSGKTTLARKLSLSLKVPILRIGEYRAKFPQTPLGEVDAWFALFRDLSRRGWKNCILETIGLNCRESFLKTSLPFDQMFTIKLEASRKVLHERICMKKKNEQGGEWLFSTTLPHKHAFVNKFFKQFHSISAEICINTSKCSKAEVYKKALREMEDIRRFLSF